MTDNEFKCPDCGKISDFEQVEFQISEEASLQCPVCKSKITLSAILTEPGTPPAQAEPIEPGVEEPQEPEGEEAPEGEEKPAEEPAANEPAPEAEGDLQITPKESVENRVSKAMAALKEGKSLVECMKILVVQPIAMLSMNPEAQVEPDDKLNFPRDRVESLNEEGMMDYVRRSYSGGRDPWDIWRKKWGVVEVDDEDFHFGKNNKLLAFKDSKVVNSKYFGSEEAGPRAEQAPFVWFKTENPDEFGLLIPDLDAGGGDYIKHLPIEKVKEVAASFPYGDQGGDDDEQGRDYGDRGGDDYEAQFESKNLHEAVPIETLLGGDTEDLWWDWFVPDRALKGLSKQIIQQLPAIMKKYGISTGGYTVYAKENPLVGSASSHVIVGFKDENNEQRWAIQWKMDGQDRQLVNPKVYKAPNYSTPVYSESKNLKEDISLEGIDTVVSAVDRYSDYLTGSWGLLRKDAVLFLKELKKVKSSEFLQAFITEIKKRVFGGYYEGWKESDYTRANKVLGFSESESLKEAKYEDMTPTPSQMRHLLQIVTKHCTDKASRDWAKDELVRIQDVRTWKSPRVEEPMAKDKWHDFPRDRVESLNESELHVTIAQSLNDWVGEDSYSGNDIKDLAYAFAMEKSRWTSFQSLVNEIADEYEKEMRANNPSERKLQITCPKKLTVEEKEVKEWEGDFANFNSKLYSACKDLSIPLESYEKVILALQEKEAIDLDKNKVVLDLAKAKSVLVDFLKGQVDTAKEMMSTVVDLKSAPQQAPDLGSAPEPKIGESDEGESVEEKVEAIVKKYFV